MDNGMLHYLAALEQQIMLHEGMQVDLLKIQAMIEPLLAGNLLDFPIMKLHDYLSIVSELVAQLLKVNEQLISLLIKIRRESLPE